MKIAVTGANGFIGQHVLVELAKYSVEIIPVIRSHSSNLPENLKQQAVLLDIHTAQKNVFEQLGCPDVVIHLAWTGLPNYKSLHHFETELPLQYNFLKNLIKSGLQSLIVTGTCFEYGMQSGGLSEEMTAIPNTPYGFAKNTLRCQLEYLQKDYTYSLTWARLFYLYGSGQSEHSLFPQLLKATQRPDKTFNMSGGEQLRDYLSVIDMAKYIVSLAINKANIGLVNISSGIPISIRKLVEQWVVKNNLEIILNFGYYPYPDYEPMAFWGNRNKLDNYLEIQ